MLERLIGSTIALTALTAFPLLGQGTAELTGVVLESERLDSLPGSVVMFNWTGRVIRTDEEGRFTIRDVPVGTHVLAAYGWGYQGVAFRVEVPVDADEQVDVGEIVLNPVTGRTVRFEGTVSDTAGTPVGGAVVNIDGRAVAISGPEGHFRAATSGSSSSLIEVRRIGYDALAVPLSVPDTGEVVAVSAVIRQIPYRLADIIVEGNRTSVMNRQMRDFYRREETTQGRFLTRDDIERFPTRYVTDVLRLAGVRVDHSAQLGATVLSVRRCIPLVLVDGFPITGGFDLDDFLIPDHVGGIEVHVGPAVPMELTFGRRPCGVVAVWTR